jgi:hypothetical protein
LAAKGGPIARLARAARPGDYVAAQASDIAKIEAAWPGRSRRVRADDELDRIEDELRAMS